MSSDPDSTKSHGESLLPFLSLLCSQLLASSWHVLGKHVMAQVPYLAPISYVLLRTMISTFFLLLAGYIREGHVPFPPLFQDDQSTHRELSLQVGLLKPSSGTTSSLSTASGNSIGLSLSKPNSSISLNEDFNGEIKKVEGQQLLPSSLSHDQHHHHRPRRKRGRHSIFKNNVFTAICSIMPSPWLAIQNILFAFKVYKQRMFILNPEAIQIIFTGLTGMLLLPMCYTTGLILTSPTVASVWDGPMIPLGCFCTAVTLGLEKMSKSPFLQVSSLLLTVGGSIIVLLVDYVHMGGGHGIEGSDDGGSKDVRSNIGGFNDHMQFIQGNMVLAGLVAAYSATALLQKQLSHYPPITLTSWMFGAGFLGCFTLLLADGMLGGRITGCSLGQALLQLYTALTTSPTFRYGLLYSAFFVSAVTMSISSYASHHLESSVITLFAATQPPITAVLEWIWEGKGLGLTKLSGMVCVGIGMWFFTHIKRMEKRETMNENGHKKKKKKRPGYHAHLKKPRDYENGNVQVGYGDCNADAVSPNGRGLSLNLTKRKAHADV